MDSPHQNILRSSKSKMFHHRKCSKPLCFFCTMNETDPTHRRAKLALFFTELPVRDDKEHVLVLSGLWNIAMAQPDDPEFLSLGLFQCMARLIHKGVTDPKWLVRDQNIYIPYYAAHIIGSYTMNKSKFAEKAVDSGVIPPLMELLRGKISWVEQRVAVRAIGHLASHDTTFEAISEIEAIELAMQIASNCIKTVCKRFLAVEDTKRLKYHSDLLTKGRGGFEMENQKAEEWAGQLQSWCLYLLIYFVKKGKGVDLICRNQKFLKELCGMWGGLANPKSYRVVLIRNLCKSEEGRKHVANSDEVLECLCNVSRSSDDFQYMAIDSLLCLLKDAEVRHKVMEIAGSFLVDLVEGRRIGQAITRTLLLDYHKIKYGDMKLKNPKAEEALKETWDLKVERRKKDKLMSEQELKGKEIMVSKLKQEGNRKFWSGDIEKAVKKFTKALDLCPLKMRKERIVLYSNRAQSYLVLRNPEAAIRDTTRALCLSNSPHGKSLWRRAQAYDMKGLARESLLDCLQFMNVRLKSEKITKKHVSSIPYYAARMFNKQMNATWMFEDARSSKHRSEEEKKMVEKSNGLEQWEDVALTGAQIKEMKGMPTILEEPSIIEKERRRCKQARLKGKKKLVNPL